MTVYVPLILFDVTEEDHEICDGILQYFHSLDALKMLYPDADFFELETGKQNIHDN